MLRSVLLAAALLATGTLSATTLGPTAQALDNTAWRLPVTPPRCTTSQADSGDVGGCLLAFYHDPATTGWGVPPAPGVGPGWNWTDSSYRGSPALEAWEREQIGANTTAVAGLRAGSLQTHVAAQALFEGFLTEISAAGYRVRDASGYSFRCTSGNGGWDCPSGDPGDLSNHSWGLAVDMNSGSNPIRSYSGVDGRTACATPIETDLPEWVIETAQRWGLYWGGYGWNGGCADTSTQRTSVYRDPPHFEFRGTPSQAAAIAHFNLRNDPSRVCFEVVDDAGRNAEACNRSGVPEAGWRLPVHVAAPPGAVAAMINLTVTGSTAPGYLTLEDCGPRSGRRQTSAITFAAGQTIATMAVVPLTADGRFCVYRVSQVHSIVDVVAYLGPDGGGSDGEPLWFRPSVPKRLTDTRRAGSCTPLLECHDGPSGDRQQHLVPTTDTKARIANLAIVGEGRPGWAQAGQCDSVGEQHLFSNVNYADGTPRSNLVIIDGGDSGACVFTFRQAHVIVDELGQLTTDSGYGWRLGAPQRKLDTRTCSAQWCDGRPAANSLTRLDLGIDSPAAAVAITVTQTSSRGFLTVGRCDVLDTGAAPTTSNVNFGAGQTTTNLAIVELDAGEMCIYTSAAAHIVVDLQAQLVAEHEVGLLPVTPTRAHDSRKPTG